MKGKRCSEEQIIRILHEAETLDNVREVCRQHNIAEQTLYTPFRTSLFTLSHFYVSPEGLYNLLLIRGDCYARPTSIP